MLGANSIHPNIISVEFAGRGKYYDFEVPEYENYVHAGVLHHNTGKTSMLACDASLIVTGQHPTRKYPNGYEGRLYFVGKDSTALAEVFYKKMFKKGEFTIIRDEATNQWRSFHPVNDAHRKHESRQAPPLIPQRFVKMKLMRSKKGEQPRKIVCENHLGQKWELSFFTGEGEPQRGVNIDGAYFSEELTEPEWYNETIMRLTDRKGFLFWDAAQQDGSDALSTLDERADREMGSANPYVWKTRWSMYDNPFLDPEEIENRKKDLLTEDDVRVRIYGEPAVKKIRLFPEFAVATHTFKREWLPQGPHVPPDWTRYMAFDPGYECAAMLFLAVPPPEFSFHPDLWLCYDEIYVQNMGVDQHVHLISQRLAGQSIHAFLIDSHQAQKHDASGKEILHQYTESMRKHNCRSVATGTGFWPGYDDVRSGTELVRSALARCASGLPRLMFLEDTCPNAITELRSIKRDKTRSKYRNVQWLDVPAKGQNDHAFDALRYLVGNEPKWHRPKAGTNWWAKRFKTLQRRMRGESQSVVLGPRRRQPEEVA
jgi:hypothetical protein